jgi:hypothetical protein
LAWKPPGTFRDEGARVIITGIGNLDTARKELGKEICLFLQTRET